MMETIFDPLEMRGVEILNRIMMAPMSQGASDVSGQALDYHLVHYGARALGGVGLVMIEDSAVTPGGRGSTRSLGLYNDEQTGALGRVVDFCHAHGACVGVQLGHTGWKAFSSENAAAPVVGATDRPFIPGGHVPHSLSGVEIGELVVAFKDAAARAVASGADVVEVHASHGYLLHQFLSPITNDRSDRYGGDLRRNARFLFEVVEAVRSAMGPNGILMVRMPIDDLVPGGITPRDAFELVSELADRGCDIVDAAAGGVVENATQFNKPVDFLELAGATRRATGIPTVVAGGISQVTAASEAISRGACDLVAVGRLLLENPYWVNSVRAD